MSNVIDDIRAFLVDEGVIEPQNIFGYEMPNNDNEFNVVLLEVNETPNPRYTRDEVAISIQAEGKSRASMRVTQEAIKKIYTYLLGRPQTTIGDNVYYNFNATVAPRLVGYRENSKPFFTCSLSLVRESQVDEGNRETIC